MSEKNRQPFCGKAARFIDDMKSLADDKLAEISVQDILDMVAEGLLKPGDIVITADEMRMLSQHWKQTPRPSI